ncbi:hypothetical protein AMAG_09539 [Allomyces macrogynus ATCC 38327]|uniref:AAA+ ATPase domain-containing protein n=1 Tax=Allomyces macrogynus (strain ATCC 38327) TaxID=578462 RepID=A0A0L0SPW2_ALLM3|nr:hypothetical protein AMAG_09539 [Allomyces macrogynus ATCC 38327]|eukprot:KNE64522.1 hypothetical protein AMAG_09539 [Allomyces macrogynus ATCC 38327]
MADHDDPMDIDATPAPVVNKGKGKPKPPPASAADGATGDHLPWVEKYRPASLSDLVAHEDITNTIIKFIDEKRLPHLLFYGPPGTGKTSTILACARRLYGPQYKSMILELNASDDRGIDVVREQIKNFASTRKIFSSGFKLIVLDEADAMTSAAQAALRRIIEKYTKNVRFCIICNYVSKIIPALQSRCTRFRFNPLEPDQVEKRLDFICQSEGVDLRPDGMQALLRLSQGDMRRALNVAQSTFAAFGTVDEAAVYATTGTPLPRDVERCTDWLMNEDMTTAIAHMASLRVDKGYALADLLGDMFLFVARMEMPDPAKIVVYEALAEIEYNLSLGCSEAIQAGALAAAFRLAVELASK